MGIVVLSLLLAGQEALDFARDVEPIFKAACVDCHGAKRPKAQFRVDSKPHAMQGGVGGPAILPGKGAESLLVKLLLSEDPEERMPRKAPALPKEQIDRIRRWIDQGAAWPDVAGAGAVTKHWAYVKPVRPRVSSGAHPIDALVRARLDVPPSPEAPKETLIRRVSLDLIGLPPSPTTPPGPTSASWTACWLRPITGSAGPAPGWTSPATPTPTASTSTRAGPCGSTATG
jgi:hypothetical protein